jgi:hypothetical protein
VLNVVVTDLHTLRLAGVDPILAGLRAGRAGQREQAPRRDKDLLVAGGTGLFKVGGEVNLPPARLSFYRVQYLRGPLTPGQPATHRIAQPAWRRWRSFQIRVRSTSS